MQNGNHDLFGHEHSFYQLSLEVGRVAISCDK